MTSVLPIIDRFYTDSCQLSLCIFTIWGCAPENFPIFATYRSPFMNRIDRLSAILVQLQSRSLVKARQIADRFDISLRTVYRDIQALEEAGIPIIGNPGIGYSLVDGYRLPPLMFSQAEALAFLTAEKLIDELTDAGSSEHYRAGMDKIRAVMRFADKNSMEDMENNMGVLRTRKPEMAHSLNMIQLLMESIYKKRVVHISYFSDYKKEVSERTIEPIGIFFSKTNWYLIAYCQIKKQYRTFKVKRLQALEVSDITFTTQHPPLKDFLHKAQKTEGLEEVVISIITDKAPMLNDDKYYYGLLTEREIGDKTELRFLTLSLDKFARWYLSFADIATIVSPDKLKRKVRQILQHVSTE